MEAVINESLKNVCKAKELIKTFLEIKSGEHSELLQLVSELLDKTEDILAEGR